MIAYLPSKCLEACKVFPAMLVGCTVVVKPSEARTTPHHTPTIFVQTFGDPENQGISRFLLNFVTLMFDGPSKFSVKYWAAQGPPQIAAGHPCCGIHPDRGDP
jgi:hypothetical protein